MVGHGLAQESFVREVWGRPRQLQTEQALRADRPALREWAFERCLDVSHSCFGNARRGIYEFVTLTSDAPLCGQRAEALDRVAAVPWSDLVPVGSLLPGGFTSMLVEPVECAPPTGLPEPFVRYEECDFTAGGSPDEGPVALRPPEDDVAEGGICICGLAFDATPDSVRDLVALKLLEGVVGSVDPGSLLRPLRLVGDVYSAVSRHFYDIDRFLIAVICAYSLSKEEETVAIVEQARFTNEQVSDACRRFEFELAMGTTNAPEHALIPFRLVAPDVTLSQVISAARSVTAQDLEAVLSGNRSLVRSTVDDVALV